MSGMAVRMANAIHQNYSIEQMIHQPAHRGTGRRVQPETADAKAHAVVAETSLEYLLQDAIFVVFVSSLSTAAHLQSTRLAHHAFQDTVPRPFPPRNSRDLQLLPLVPSAEGRKPTNDHVKRHRAGCLDRTAPWHSGGTSQCCHPKLLLLSALFVLDGIDGLPMDRSFGTYDINGIRVIDLQ